MVSGSQEDDNPASLIPVLTCTHSIGSDYVPLLVNKYINMALTWKPLEEQVLLWTGMRESPSGPQTFHLQTYFQP